MASEEEILRAAYRAFNDRDVQGALELMHPDGSITVTIHQTVRDAKTDELLSDTQVLHRWWLENGLAVRMDVVEPAG